jgi:hypothetical protein
MGRLLALLEIALLALSRLYKLDLYLRSRLVPTQVDPFNCIGSVDGLLALLANIGIA